MPSTLIQYNLAGLFAFDPVKIQIANNPAFPRAALLDLRPATTPLATAHGGFSLYGLDLNWSNGSVVGTPFPAVTDPVDPDTPIVSGGLLDLKGGLVVRYMDYGALQNFDGGNVGTLRFEYIPNYAGSPAATRTLVDLFNVGDNKNRILIQHTAAGNLEVSMWDNVAALQISFSVAYVAVMGVSREIEIDFNSAGGATHLFLQGVSIATSATVYTRDGVLSTLRIGADNTGATFSDAEFDNLIYFNAILHVPPNYVPNAPISPTIYAMDNPGVLHGQGVAANSISSLSEIVINPSAGVIKYTLAIAGTVYWYDPVAEAWVMSNSTYAEANTAEEITTNAATAPFPIFSLVQITAYIQSITGRTTPELESITLGHTVVVGDIPTCKVFGHFLDNGGVAIRKGDITFTLVQPAQRYTKAGASNDTFVESEQTVQTDDNGYFEVNLVRSSEYIDPLQKYRVSFLKSPTAVEFAVPDQTSVDLGNLI